MSNTVYALLVGINDYPADVGRLTGCVNDVTHMHEYLKETFGADTLAVEVLTNQDATRANIIAQFRAHLGRAKTGDVALFQYCGHGAQWKSAPEFREFFRDGKDEGLVCIDSRKPDGYDLADKELAVLLSEVAKNDPHLAVVLDCCHSGSGTRSVDAFKGLVARVTHEVTTERPIESYLDGYYDALRLAGQSFSIPTPRHILLAACDRTEKAQESTDASGVFTTSMLDVLRKSRGGLSYADLFVRSRATVRNLADNQNPQFETYGDFNAQLGFLGGNVSLAGKRYAAYFDRGSWRVDCGAIHGVPTDSTKAATMALFADADRTKALGLAKTSTVGAQRSVITLAFEGNRGARYEAEITSLPVPGAPVVYRGDAAHVASRASELQTLQTVLDGDQSATVELSDIEAGARYAIELRDVQLARDTKSGRLLVLDGRAPKSSEQALEGLTRVLAVVTFDPQSVVQAATVVDNDIADAMRRLLPALKSIAEWERSLALQNAGTAMDPSLVNFVYAERLDDGTEHLYDGRDVLLEYVKTSPARIQGRIKARNRTTQPLNVALVYFPRSFGVAVLQKAELLPGAEFTTLYGDGEKDGHYLPEGVNESTDRLMLLVSTEPVDAFLLAQQALVLGAVVPPAVTLRNMGGTDDDAEDAKVFTNEWFTKSMNISLVRRLNTTGATDASFAQGAIVVKGHASVTASVSLGAAAATGRAVGSSVPDFYRAFEQQGLSMVNFGRSRGAGEQVLELTGISNADALRTDPLQIELNVPLEPDEVIIPIVFDGQHTLLGGDTFKDDNGTTHISIDHLPEVADRRRSLGGSLKLYFFKTVLRKQDVNLLRWVEYKTDGSFVQHSDGVAERVTAARNVMLLVHGIIGDTEGMARGVKDVALTETFDLVLTYDYENLSTPIEQTALNLKARLAAVGLDANDDKRLTLLVHSMGGLVSRWFIEREGGAKVVDHLVMCGTPNNGSPFGKVGAARQILSVLTTLAANYAPPLLPVTGPLLFLLNRSKQLTPTLEQMNPTSSFIQQLNASADPGIPYTILAGDVAQYQEPGDPFFARLVTKVGQGNVFELLFSNQPNDIAVQVDSIVGVGRTRRMLPETRGVACHHLNYFVSAPGQEALRKVAW